MPFFPDLDANAGVPQIYKRHSREFLHWIRMGDEVMTRDGPLSQGERELLATYVSSLNNCAYCRAAHLPAMELHGITQQTVDALLHDIDTAPVAAALRPVFRFARKLTLEPAQLTRDDADAVLAAGWDEDALHATIAVVCRFSFMNRLVMGYGLVPPQAEAARQKALERSQKGYAKLHDLEPD